MPPIGGITDAPVTGARSILMAVLAMTNDLPLYIFMDLVNPVMKTVDKGDCEGRKGRIEIYMCGVLMERGVRKVMMKCQMS